MISATETPISENGLREGDNVTLDGSRYSYEVLEVRDGDPDVLVRNTWTDREFFTSDAGAEVTP